MNLPSLRRRNVSSLSSLSAFGGEGRSEVVLLLPSLRRMPSSPSGASVPASRDFHRLGGTSKALTSRSRNSMSLLTSAATRFMETAGVRWLFCSPSHFLTCSSACSCSPRLPLQAATFTTPVTINEGDARCVSSPGASSTVPPARHHSTANPGYRGMIPSGDRIRPPQTWAVARMNRSAGSW